MSIQSQIVIAEHLSIETICVRLRHCAKVAHVSARPMRAKEHWLIEVIDTEGVLQAIDAFLQSYAAEDYSDLGLPQSSLLSMSAGPSSGNYLRAVGNGSPTWFRANEWGVWTEVSGD